MDRSFFGTVLLVLMLGLAGCSREGATPVQAVPKLTAAGHLSAADELKNSQEDWPLAIWHYQQFLETAPEEGIPAAEVDRAKVQLEALRQDYVALYSDRSLGALETENATLRRNNKTLEDQIERLKADNAVLNSTLLKMQQASGRR